MSIRTTSSTVSFSQPFLLSGIDGEQPAGSYTVETDEELLQGVSVTAYRRVSTWIRLPPRRGSTELARVVDLDPRELAAILAGDARTETEPAVSSSRASAERQEATGAPRQSATRGWKAAWHSWLALNANELTWTALIAGGVILAALFADR